MYEVDMFPSRFFIIEDALEHEELMKVLNTIKKDTDKIASIQSGQNGPTYKTNYPQAEVHGILFKPILKQLNNHLAKDNVSFNLIRDPWYAEYGEYDFHGPHIHTTDFNPDLRYLANTFQYSGLICLSNFGETSFINPNPSSSTSEIIELPSKYNRAILFPSNIYHYVIPHGLRDKVRATFSFNCSLKIG